MFTFCGLYSKAKQDEGAAGTLHVVVAEGNYVAFGKPFANSFMSFRSCCTFRSIFTKLFLVLPPPPPGIHVDTFLGLQIVFTFYNTTFIRFIIIFVSKKFCGGHSFR